MKKIIKERKFSEYTHGCLMLNFRINGWGTMLSGIIDENHIYYGDNNEYGWELEPHCTILYGFVPYDGIEKDIISDLKSFKVAPENIFADILDISHFESSDYDVVKFAVKSKTLSELNSHFNKKYEVENNHPKYNPHITLAYVKSGFGKKYGYKFESGIHPVPAYFSFSYPPHNKIKIQ